MAGGDGDQRSGSGLPALIAAAGSSISAGEAGLAARAKALASMVPMLASTAKAAGVRAVVAGRWLTDVILDVAPHLVVRDAATLRRQHPGLSSDAIAEGLITSAARTTAAIGAAAGTLAAIEFTAPPALLGAPVQLAAETVAVVAIELKLVAELHEITGLAVPGGLRESAPAYLGAWTHRSAAEPGDHVGVGAVLGQAVPRELRRRLARRMGRSATTMAPFMAGAAVGAEVNRRATHDLGEKVLADLNRQRHRRADIIIDAPSS